MEDLWRHDRCTQCGRVVASSPRRRVPPKFCIICRAKQQEPYKVKARKQKALRK